MIRNGLVYIQFYRLRDTLERESHVVDSPACVTTFFDPGTNSQSTIETTIRTMTSGGKIQIPYYTGSAFAPCFGHWF